jgi:hypothetical protein
MSTYVNARPQPVRVVLSDGSERVVGPWGLAFLPESVHMVHAEFAADSRATETESAHDGQIAQRASQRRAA